MFNKVTIRKNEIMIRFKGDNQLVYFLELNIVQRDVTLVNERDMNQIQYHKMCSPASMTILNYQYNSCKSIR